MPIYAYKCESCGHAFDVLQKMSDAVLTDCPSCHAAALQKQVTAAGFQLKGSGWYVTDFRNGSGGAAAVPPPKAEDGKPAETKPAVDSAAAKPAETSAAPAAAPAPAPAPAPASSGGTSSAA
ncbi:FmdB family zinc ribbon protein [Rhodoferax sp.]|uniref:FmdB family zinc ribbon protein n=1 Tax=Rhodoferax sp. TaxID=50421 RepID=UPI0025E29D62|nr:FmdB family zinc ribbon protein [Rhodoferax sp.]